jgi:hypothetical protein
VALFFVWARLCTHAIPRSSSKTARRPYARRAGCFILLSAGRSVSPEAAVLGRITSLVFSSSSERANAQKLILMASAERAAGP